jgi:hypothetical protein
MGNGQAIMEGWLKPLLEGQGAGQMAGLIVPVRHDGQPGEAVQGWMRSTGNPSSCGCTREIG